MVASVIAWRGTMRTYKELVDLAMTCAKQAHITTSKDVAHELWRMAVGYQQQAAHLNAGKIPDIGEKPAHLRPIADQQLIEVNAKGR
jgi:hypothetical protein